MSDRTEVLGTCKLGQYEHAGPHRRYAEMGQKLPPFPCVDWTPLPNPAAPPVDQEVHPHTQPTHMVFDDLLHPNIYTDLDAYIAPVAQPVQGEPPKLAKWEDPDVQRVYQILCDDLQHKPDEEHWEGYVARWIVQELRASPTPEAAAFPKAFTAEIVGNLGPIRYYNADEIDQWRAGRKEAAATELPPFDVLPTDEEAGYELFRLLRNDGVDAKPPLVSFGTVIGWLRRKHVAALRELTHANSVIELQAKERDTYKHELAALREEKIESGVKFQRYSKVVDLALHLASDKHSYGTHRTIYVALLERAEKAEAERDELQAKLDGRWIPVTERLPADGQTVLVTNGSYVNVERYPYRLAQGMGEPPEEQFDCPTTHWMPMPDPSSLASAQAEKHLTREDASQR